MSNENKPENMQELDSETTLKACEKLEKHDLEQKGAVSEDKFRVSTPPLASKPGIAIRNVESESLNSLLVYDSDSSSSSEMMKLHWHELRDDSSSSSSSSSSSEDEGSDSDGDSDSDSPTETDHSPSKGAIRKEKPPLKVNGEFTIDNLPPVPDISTLNISVEDEVFVHMGNILGIVDKLVTVAAIPNMPAYDLDTILFLDNGKKALGMVFDVLGQVTSPIYAIRFNSLEDIKNLQIEIGAKVYSAPTSKHTQYVFLQQLLKLKGSDASWLGDTEVPLEFADYSDDENERQRRHLGPIKRTHSGDNHKKFESTMNKKNIINTKFNKYMDSYKQSKLHKGQKKPRGITMPVFDPSIPPPTLRPSMGFYQQPAPPGVHFYPMAENNNGQNFVAPTFYMNNFVAPNYYANNHPGPSHQ